MLQTKKTQIITGPTCFRHSSIKKKSANLGGIIPSERTVRKIMEQIHLLYKSKQKPRRIVLSSWQKDRTLHNGKTEIHGLAIFHELLKQPQKLLGHQRNPSCCKTAKILRSGCHSPLRFKILVGNVSSVIDNFIHCSDFSSKVI